MEGSSEAEPHSLHNRPACKARSTYPCGKDKGKDGTPRSSGVWWGWVKVWLRLGVAAGGKCVHMRPLGSCRMACVPSAGLNMQTACVRNTGCAGLPMCQKPRQGLMWCVPMPMCAHAWGVCAVCVRWRVRQAWGPCQRVCLLHDGLGRGWGWGAGGFGRPALCKTAARWCCMRAAAGRACSAPLESLTHLPAWP